MFIQNTCFLLRLFSAIILLTLSSTHATIRYVNQGQSPQGQPITLLGLEHWYNDKEAIKQAMYLTALFHKNKKTIFLVALIQH